MGHTGGPILSRTTSSEGEIGDLKGAMEVPIQEGSEHSVVRIPLDAALESLLCRRGRRRLRLVTMSCGVFAQLDRVAGLLVLSGSQAGITEVRRQLASFQGPRKEVPGAVWAELMRTRKLTEGSEAGLLAKLQQQSGCRIHIERERQEVRLLGLEEEVAIADHLLDELAKQCWEISLAARTELLDVMAMRELAQAYGVTLRLDPGQVVVLGLSHKVIAAAEKVSSTLGASKLSAPTSPWSASTSSQETKTHGKGRAKLGTNPQRQVAPFEQPSARHMTVVRSVPGDLGTYYSTAAAARPLPIGCGGPAPPPGLAAGAPGRGGVCSTCGQHLQGELEQALQSHGSEQSQGALRGLFHSGNTPWPQSQVLGYEDASILSNIIHSDPASQASHGEAHQSGADRYDPFSGQFVQVRWSL